MDDILSRFSINCHSSIRYAGAMTVWFDPFRVADAPCDADVIFVTHDHYDHFSPEDIRRVMKPDAVLVLPETCVAAALQAGFAPAQLLPVRSGEAYTVKGLPFTAVPAYNLGKPFHPRGNRWVGYVVTLEGRRVYVAGDTDDTPDARSVSCDVAFLPVGGTYTMTAARPPVWRPPSARRSPSPPTTAVSWGRGRTARPLPPPCRRTSPPCS